MPFVRIDLFEGRTLEQKKALAKEVTEAVVRNTGPGRKHHRTHPNSRPHHHGDRPGPNRKGVQESLF